ncbi:murein L,D-transpeptidase [Streptomyces caniscabiei]|uniref:L,D-transpeptidase family protein n=1 Tax=Streptomyces caniscabiei TaxID=2746961 RepID=UPI0029A7AAFB|nr:L,D-transpeptidase family protein [Streptomyces caniscabiei]MDX2601905.1 murein L,D-transpeptidase [Streptomyces caniscabiei]MDX2737340.1 murein L,D-transpeptidase [Streptomyces caniscabiei]MDX2781799.1 murein L,D-transpeptidase [Streptomyces caniscabiei]
MSDELTLRLRELAESAESLPPGSGAEVRATAGRRRRRRRTTAAVAGGCAAAGLAAVLTLNTVSHGTERGGSALAASAPPSATAEAPDATVDLSRRVLTVAGRELPISAGTAETPTPTGLMTVTAKADVKLVPGATVGFGDGYDGQLTWVLELTPAGTDATGATAAAGGSAWTEATAGTSGTAGTGTNAGAGAFDPTDPTDPADPSAETGRTEPTGGPTDGTDGTDGTGPGESFSAVPTRPPGDREVWIAALPLYELYEKAPGTSDMTSGWIGLRTADARWLYGRLPTGAIVEIKGTSPTPPTVVPTPTPSQTPPG